ncbi:MAG: PilZ domain-containing protein [Thermoanaerobaculia bacterium]|nr:PilZ domain-containing protein [Thermoanaerobaculia bacterium]
MESDDNVSGEFQRSTRMPLDAVVRLHFQGTVAYQNGFAANVSATGMFVKHPAPPPLGTQLVFEFNLGADRKPVQGAGEVVWVREKYLGPGQPAGVGIRFLQLDSQSRDHIAEALFEYLEQSLADDSLLDGNGFPFADEAPVGATATTAGTDAPAARGTAGVDAAAATAAAAGTASYDVLPTAPASAAAPFRERPDGLDSGLDDADRGPALTTESHSQPFDFAALERLPQRAPLPGRSATPPDQGAPGRAERPDPAAADGRRAFSVFSPLDEADAQTADIVREALREEAPLPSMAAAAAASSARGGSMRWLVWLILALVGGGGYFAWQQWGGDRLTADAGAPGSTSEAPGEEPLAPAPRRPEPLTAAPEPGTTLAQAVGVDPNAVSPAAAPPLATGPSTAATEEPDALDSEVERPAAAASDLAADAATALAADEPPRPPAAPAETASAPASPATPPANASPDVASAAAAPAQRLTGIEWRQSAGTAGETVLVLVGDGAFRTGSFSYSEIGGENPRVLIKLKGMANPYRGAAPRAPEGAGTLVRGVRTGFHVTATGNEIHVVVDLAQRGIKVVSLAPADSGLTLVLAP